MISDQPGPVSVKHSCTSRGVMLGRERMSMPMCVLPCESTCPLLVFARGLMSFLLSRIKCCQLSGLDSSTVAE